MFRIQVPPNTRTGTPPPDGALSPSGSAQPGVITLSLVAPAEPTLALSCRGWSCSGSAYCFVGFWGCEAPTPPGSNLQRMQARPVPTEPCPLQPDSNRGLHAGTSAVAVLRNSQLACPLRRPGLLLPWPVPRRPLPAPGSSGLPGCGLSDRPGPGSALSLLCSLPAAPTAVSQLLPPRLAVQLSRAFPSPPTVSAASSWGPPACCGGADTRLHPERTLVPRRMQSPDVVPGRLCLQPHLPSPRPAQRRQTSSWCPQRPRPGKARQCPHSDHKPTERTPTASRPQPSGNSRFGKSREPWRSSARGHPQGRRTLGRQGHLWSCPPCLGPRVLCWVTGTPLRRDPTT